MRLFLLALATSLSLAATAFELVSQQAAPIFGIYKPCEGPLCSYMKEIDDSTKIENLNLVGTHDCATWNYTQATQASFLKITGPLLPIQVYKCQHESVNGFAGMLEMGVRVFDLRVGYSPDSFFGSGDGGRHVTFYHAAAMLSPTATLDDILYMFYNWLEENPSETIILTIKIEHGKIDQGIQEKIYNSLNTPQALKYFVQTHQALGTLGESRGKINLFSRFEYDLLPSNFSNRFGLDTTPSLWVDNGANSSIAYNANSTVYIEDYYNVEPIDFPTKIQWKYNATSLHLDFARSYNQELFISFISASGYPKVMALGCDLTGLEGMNQRMLKFFQDPARKGGRYGIVMLDFVDASTGLIEAIIGSQ